MSPSRVKMEVPLPYSCSLISSRAVLEVVDADDAEDGAEDLFAVDLHLGLDVVEEAGAEEEAFALGQGVSRGRRRRAQRLRSCRGRCSLVTLSQVRLGDERAEVCALASMPSPIWSFAMRCSSLPRRVSAVCVADGDGDGDGHAALAGGAVGGADEGVGGLIEIGVGHDDHVVLRAAEGLHALAVLGAVAVDVLGDGRGADEADGLDGGVGEDGVDGDFVAVDDVEDAVGQAGFLEHLGEEDGGAGVALAGLEDEGVAAGEGDAGTSTCGTMAGKLKGVMPATTPSG